MKLFSLVFLACLPRLSAPVETPSFPETHAGRHLEELLVAFNAGDEASLRAWEREHRDAASRERQSADAVVAALRGVRSQTGSLRPEKILTDQAFVSSVLVEFENVAAWGELRVTCAPEPPHGVLSFTVVPAEPPSEPVSYEGWETLPDLLHKAALDGGLPALAVAVTTKDRILDKGVVGLRVAGGRDAVQLDDRFHFGSVTKAMTATAAAVLVERGELRWDVTLRESFPSLSMLPEYEPVTLVQLLNHRGGIPRHMTFDEPTMARLNGLPGAADEQRALYVAEVLSETPVAQPGTAMHYSNAGYAIAGHIAERASGRSWEDLLHEEVFDPLGMALSDIGWPASGGRQAQPLGHANSQPVPVDAYVLGAFMHPAGDVHGSIEDLARFAQAHLKGLAGEDGVLRAETVQRLHSTAPTQGYAGGWMVERRDDGSELHWHNGSAGTFYALVVLEPRADRAVVLATNTGGPRCETVAWKVVEELRARRGGDDRAAHDRHAKTPAAAETDGR